MTYHAHIPMNGLTEYFGGKSITDCLDKANAQAQPLIDTREQLRRSWNPTGTFRSAEIRAVVKQCEALLDRAEAGVFNSPWAHAASDASSQVSSQIRFLRSVDAESAKFLGAADFADSRRLAGVQAPDLKKWVLRAFTEANNAWTMAFAYRCMEPGILTLVRDVQAFFKKVADFISKVIGFIADAADKLTKVPGIIGDLITAGMVVGGLGGAYYLFKRFRSKGK